MQQDEVIDHPPVLPFGRYTPRAEHPIIGGFGVIHFYDDTLLGRRVVVKFAKRDTESAITLEEETRRVAAIRHRAYHERLTS